MTGVIYARYSSDNQREESIEGQLRECEAFANKNDIRIVGTYIDHAFSARTDNRPDFQKMIKDSASKKFETVIVWKLDRFARCRHDSAHYKSVLRKNGVKVASTTEKILMTPETPYAEAVLESVPAHLRKIEEYELQFVFHADGWFLLHCITTLLKNDKLKEPTEGQRKSLTTLIANV